MAEQDAFEIQDGELLQIFIDEAREQLDTLDQGLVRLEHEPHNVELMQSIFRAAHTLKGSSGAMGFRRMAELTHVMEDVLDRVRDGKLAVTGTVADALLRGLDQLRAMEEAMLAGRAATLAVPCNPEMLHELRQVIAGNDGGQDTDKAALSAPVGALPDEQVVLLVNFAADCQMPGIRAFMVLRALENFGDIHRCIPDRAAIDAGQIGTRLLVIMDGGDSDEALRQAASRVTEVEWVRLARGKAAAGMRLDMPEREHSRAEEPPEAKATAAAGVPTGAAQQSVRVSVETLDRIVNLVGELVLDRTRITQMKDELSERHPTEEVVRDLETVSSHLGSIVGELHEQVMQARMLPVSQLFNRFPRLVRDLSRGLSKEVDFVVSGESEQLDRSVIEKLVDPLTHLLRNAVDHGLESPQEREQSGKPRCGTVRLSAQRQEEHVLIRISDDGPGLHVERLKDKALAAGFITAERARIMSRQEAFDLIFTSGISTAARVSDVSGRGVGMDVVKRNIDALGGMISVESTEGCGTTIDLRIPLTLAIVRALIVRVGQVTMAVPLALIEETVRVERSAVSTVRGRAMLNWRNNAVPVIPLAQAMPGCGMTSASDQLELVVVKYSSTLACLAVDGIVGQQEIVVKPLGGFLGEIPGLAGATILGNGRVALILDAGKLFERGLLQRAAEQASGARMPLLSGRYRPRARGTQPERGKH